MKLLFKRHKKASQEFLISDEFLTLLQSTKDKVLSDSSNTYIYLKEFMTELKAYEEKPTRVEQLKRDFDTHLLTTSSDTDSSLPDIQSCFAKRRRQQESSSPVSHGSVVISPLPIPSPATASTDGMLTHSDRDSEPSSSKPHMHNSKRKRLKTTFSPLVRENAADDLNKQDASTLVTSKCAELSDSTQDSDGTPNGHIPSAFRAPRPATPTHSNDEVEKKPSDSHGDRKRICARGSERQIQRLETLLGVCSRSEAFVS